MYRTRFILWFVVIALGLTAPLAGCGQKGDLYLPDQQTSQKSK